ncbi:PIR Superfamily Protein [Plasmodium malariae]|uniref:PIR Superfamily Protein n=1 Tax=Plasmodium malariae TaxID=5858 RepID=A0A1A8WR31_PLAMA|nr:PIR Superfamily Protein [Plasmodium malariae]
MYNKISLKLGNICLQELKKIDSEILDNLKELYKYYDNFRRFKCQENDSNDSSCENVRKIYNIHVKNYKKYQGNSESPFCEKLIIFKDAYDNKMRDLIPCSGLPHILPPMQVYYVFVASLTTATILLASFTIFFVYKVNKKYS